MAQAGLQRQVAHLRDQVDRLKNSLDQTLQSFENLSEQTGSLARDARELSNALGEGQPAGGVPWGLFLTLGLGAGIVWLISPETRASLRDFLTARYQNITGPTQHPLS